MANVSTEPAPVRRDDMPRPRPRRARGRLLAALAALAVLVCAGAYPVGALPGWTNPFRAQTMDRSAAPLLLALRDVAQYRAATGTFQVLVDVEHDTTNVPSVISGERTTLFATGNVDGLVDFSAVGPDRVTMSPDRRSVTIALPTPVLGAAVVDPAQSRVVGRQRGLVQRIGGLIGDNPGDDQELYVLAGQKLGQAAQRSDLSGRAEQSTRTMLTTLAGSLGFERVTVTFAAADQH